MARPKCGPPHPTPPHLQSYGRGLEKNATCPTYIAATAGCGTSWPTLARAPSAVTKWTFEPAPGGVFKWFIRMSVSRASAVISQLPDAACCGLMLQYHDAADACSSCGCGCCCRCCCRRCCCRRCCCLLRLPLLRLLLPPLLLPAAAAAAAAAVSCCCFLVLSPAAACCCGVLLPALVSALPLPDAARCMLLPALPPALPPALLPCCCLIQRCICLCCLLSCRRVCQPAAHATTWA